MYCLAIRPVTEMSPLTQGRELKLIDIRTCEVPQVTKYNQKQVQNLMKAKAAYRLRLTEEDRKAQWKAGLQNLAKWMISNTKAGENNG